MKSSGVNSKTVLDRKTKRRSLGRVYWGRRLSGKSLCQLVVTETKSKRAVRHLQLHNKNINRNIWLTFFS